MTGEQRRGEGPYRTWARHRGGILQPLYFYLICLHYTPNTFTFILLYSVSRLFVQFWTDFRATWWIRWTRRRWSDTASTRMVARLCGAKDIVLAFSTFTRLCDDAIPRTVRSGDSCESLRPHQRHCIWLVCSPPRGCATRWSSCTGSPMQIPGFLPRRSWCRTDPRTPAQCRSLRHARGCCSPCCSSPPAEPVNFDTKRLILNVKIIIYNLKNPSFKNLNTHLARTTAARVVDPSAYV